MKVYTKLIVIVCLFLGFSFQVDPIYIEPITKEALGEKLFFEKDFSKDRTLSCASCHIPEFGFSDTVAFSVGVGGKLGKRNTQSVMNMASRQAFFYDGRAKDLKDQVHFPVADQNEMAFDLEKVAKRLSKNKNYTNWFKDVYDEKPNADNIADAIAAYEKTLETNNSPFDNWMNDVPNHQMSESAIRGREVFLSKKAKCFDCHFSPDFTGDEFRNIGLYDEDKFKDKGRYDITKDPKDLGKFKVPGLRNVAITGPYMHNGLFETLEEVVEYYDNPYKWVINPINMDSLMVEPLHLSLQEKSDLVDFMKSLTDKRFLK